MTSQQSSFQPPPLSNETIECRLETGAHGSRASLTKCAVRFRSFLQSVGSAEANAEAIEESKLLLESELSLYKVEFTKMALKVQANQQDVELLQTQSQDLELQIAARKQEVEELQRDMKRSKQVWGYKEEYEALAKMANHRPSRAILEKRLKLLQKQMELACQKQEALEQELSIRQTQFQALVQCMLDLKATVEGESKEGKEKDEGQEQSEEEDGIVEMDTTL